MNSTYFERAESWAVDSRTQATRSRRVAWTIAGIATAIALFEAVALAMLIPLKTVQPITLLVDRQTGYVQAIDPISPRRIAADDALTSSFLAQYVTAREGFDRATVAADYRKVALWSSGRARSAYLAKMPAENPESPFQLHRPGTTVQARVKSVSRLSPGVALVRHDTQVLDGSGRAYAPQAWISVVRFRYTDAPMGLEDRLVSPLGFQVTGYRRDAEAPPAVAEVATGSMTLRPARRLAATAVNGLQDNAVQTVAPADGSVIARPNASGADRPRADLARRRDVSLDQLPLGSPLLSSGSPPSAAGSTFRP